MIVRDITSCLTGAWVGVDTVVDKIRTAIVATPPLATNGAPLGAATDVTS